MPNDAATRYHRTTLALTAGMIALTFLVYLPSMRGGPIWDDDELIFDNPFIRAPDGLYHYWLTTEPPDYFPLWSTTHWLEWRLWGEATTGYHVVNTLLHAFSAVVIWRVLRRLEVPGAWVAAAVFAVHPVSVASVAWISERKNTLSLLLFCMSVLAYLRFEDASAIATRRRRCWYGAALASFSLALLAKTSVVSMPVVLLLLAWWRRRHIAKPDLARCSPFFAVSMVFGLITLYFHFNKAIGDASVRPEGFLSRLAATGWCVWFYLYKCLLPVNLSMIYPRWNVTPQSFAAWIPILALAVTFVVAWRYRSDWSMPLLVMMAYFVAMLAPVLGLIDMVYHQHSLVADHLQYVGLIGPITVVVAAGARQIQRWHLHRHAAPVAALVVLAVLSILTWQKSYVYRNPVALWTDTVEKNPNTWTGHYNLGHAQQTLENNPHTAIDHYRRALKIRPDFADAHHMIGVSLAKLGQHEDATDHLQRALEISPNNAGLHNNAAMVLGMRGDTQGAVRHLLRALELNPDSARAHFHLGLAFEELGKWNEAIMHFRQALNIDPDYPKADEIHKGIERYENQER